MSAHDIGRICIKKVGREANRKCVVVDIIDKSYVLITGPKTLTKVKRRRANVNHLKSLMKKLAISRGASDEEIMVIIKIRFLRNSYNMVRKLRK